MKDKTCFQLEENQGFFLSLRLYLEEIFNGRRLEDIPRASVLRMLQFYLARGAVQCSTLPTQSALLSTP